MMKIKLIYFIVLFACFVPRTYAGCDNSNPIPWQAWRSNENFSLSYADVTTGDIYALQANITLNTSIDEFYLFLHDAPSVMQWLDRVETVTITTLSNQKSILTTYFDGFLFVDPRVMSVESTVTYRSASSMLITVKQNPIAPPKNTVVMTMDFGCWIIEKNKNDTIDVTYQFLAKPNGGIPIWMANNLAKKSLWKSLENLHRLFPVHYNNE